MSSDAAAGGAAPPFRRDPLFVAILRSFASAAVILVKTALSPAMYLARRAGFAGSWPGRLSEAVNRACLPLTEKSDREWRVDVTPALARGDHLPDVAVALENGSLFSLSRDPGTPLLLILIRGSWCSYSRLRLADLERSAPDFADAGLRVLVVTNREEAAWWSSRGISFQVAADPKGELFKALGILAESWMDTAWGRIIPHEGGFLFDGEGRLVTADVRRVSGFLPGQRFLSAARWLEAARPLSDLRREARVDSALDGR